MKRDRYILCDRCLMTFLVADPLTDKTERLVCSECSRPFWCGSTKALRNAGKCRVGVEPSKLHRWGEDAA